MQIAYRIRSDDGFTDVCCCPEFSNVISGLGIAWVCGRMSGFQCSACSVLVPKPNKTTHFMPASLKGSTPARFIGIWADKEPIEVSIQGIYRETQLSISVALEKKAIQIFYPKNAESQVLQFEAQLTQSIAEHFELLKKVSDTDMGNKIISQYKSPLFVDAVSGAKIAEVFSTFPQAMIRWISLQPAEQKELHRVNVQRHRAEKGSLIQKCREENISEIVVALRLDGRPVTLICKCEEQTLYLAWDKWLNKDIPSLITWFNTSLYDKQAE